MKSFVLGLALVGTAFAQPPAPTGLAVAVLTQSVTLTWNFANVSNYQVLRANGACGSTTSAFAVLAPSLEANTYMDPTVQPGLTYAYEVENELSGVLSAPTCITATIPGAAPASHSVTVAWKPGVQATGVTVPYYILLRAPGKCSAKSVFSVIAKPKSTSYVDTGVTAGATYCYRVKTYAVTSVKALQGGTGQSPPSSPPVTSTVP
jgi:hypothetical protein